MSQIITLCGAFLYSNNRPNVRHTKLALWKPNVIFYIKGIINVYVALNLSILSHTTGTKWTCNEYLQVQNVSAQFSSQGREASGEGFVAAPC